MSRGRGGVAAALARAAGWLVEPVAAPAPAEPSTFLDCVATARAKQERDADAPVREARVRPMELRARPMELRLVASPPPAAVPAPAVAEPGAGGPVELPVTPVEVPPRPAELPVTLVEVPVRPAELPVTPVEVRVRPAELPSSPVVAIVGLAPGCGATTLARALAATLARRDHSGAAIVASPAAPIGSNLSTRTASRLAARIASSRLPARAAGRLCLAGTTDPAALGRSIAGLAPLVLDLPPSDAAAAAPAQIVIVIAAGDSEPALAELAARTLATGGTEPLTVVSGADVEHGWERRAFLVLPRSRLGAWLASAGWEPRGAFGAAVARIADACEEAACV